MSDLLGRVGRYFGDLGFYPDQIEFGPGLPQRRLVWSLTAYVLLLLGILAQQTIDLGKKPLNPSWHNLTWPMLLASAVVAFALFPPFMAWFNRKRKKPSWEHILWAFSFGFFVNLSTNFIWKKFF
jgi:hypothetical protein